LVDGISLFIKLFILKIISYLLLLLTISYLYFLKKLNILVEELF